MRTPRAVRVAAADEHDDWTEALAALAEGWAALDEPEDAVSPLEIAVSRFRSLGAGSLEAWARSLLAGCLARADAPGAREVALAAEAFARTAGTPGPHALAYAALAIADPPHAVELRALATGLFDETGLAEPRSLRPMDPPPIGPAGSGVEPVAIPDATSGLTIRCFGAFSMAVAGREVDLAALKPRPRALLRLLAVNAGRPIHREVIQDALWPDVDPEAGSRSLHVALSALRRELEPEGGRDGREVLVRDGDAYRIAVPPGSRVDVVAFDEAMSRARSTRGRNDELTVAGYRAAIAEYAGDLLPEDGPADWIVARRERARADYVEAAVGLAELIVADRPAEAAAVCVTALGIDGYHDPLWRLLIEARERAGDRAAAVNARTAYAKMLAGLGLPVEPAADPPPESHPRARPSAGVTSLRGTRPR